MKFIITLFSIALSHPSIHPHDHYSAQVKLFSTKVTLAKFPRPDKVPQNIDHFQGPQDDLKKLFSALLPSFPFIRPSTSLSSVDDQSRIAHKVLSYGFMTMTEKQFSTNKNKVTFSLTKLAWKYKAKLFATIFISKWVSNLVICMFADMKQQTALVLLL